MHGRSKRRPDRGRAPAPGRRAGRARSPARATTRYATAPGRGATCSTPSPGCMSDNAVQPWNVRNTVHPTGDSTPGPVRWAASHGSYAPAPSRSIGSNTSWFSSSRHPPTDGESTWLARPARVGARFAPPDAVGVADVGRGVEPAGAERLGAPQAVQEAAHRRHPGCWRASTWGRDQYTGQIRDPVDASVFAASKRVRNALPGEIVGELGVPGLGLVPLERPANHRAAGRRGPRRRWPHRRRRRARRPKSISGNTGSRSSRPVLLDDLVRPGRPMSAAQVGRRSVGAPMARGPVSESIEQGRRPCGGVSLDRCRGVRPGRRGSSRRTAA